MRLSTGIPALLVAAALAGHATLPSRGVCAPPDSSQQIPPEQRVAPNSWLGVSGTQDNLPDPRYLHTCSLDPVRQRMVVFGGIGPTGSRNDVWVLPLGGPPAWTQLPVAGTPPIVRECHSAIYDPLRDRMVVFGGSNSNGRFNDVYELTFAGTPTWTKLTPAGTPPSVRNLHTAIYDPVRDRMIVFGGYSPPNFLNEVWVLNLSGTPVWSQLFPGGTAPSPRRQHSAIYDPVRDRMVICGGQGPGQAGDVWAVSLVGAPTWSPISTSGPSPLPNDSHSAIYDPAGDRMVVFGGVAPNLYRKDTWALSLASRQWTLLSSGVPPLDGREMHGAVLDQPRQRMVVFGGLGENGAHNDTWAFTLGAAQWVAISPGPPGAHPAFYAGVSGIPAELTLGQSMTITIPVLNNGIPGDDGRIAVGFPGLTDPADARWITSSSSGDSPGFRTFASGSALQRADCAPMIASYLVAEYADSDWQSGEINTLTLTVLPSATGTFSIQVRATLHTAGANPCDFTTDVPAGGAPGVDQPNFGVTVFTVTVRPPPPPGTPTAARFGHSAILDPLRDRMIVFGGDAGPASNETWALSLGDPSAWSLLVPSGTPPAARRGHTAIYDPVRDRMSVLGGADPTRFTDVWALSLGGAPAWTEITPAGAGPTARRDHGAIYDPVRDRMIVFGGSTTGGEVNDVWTLSLAGTPAWTPLAPLGSPPFERSLFGACYDPVRDRMLVFGGRGVTGGPNNDLWSL